MSSTIFEVPSLQEICQNTIICMLEDISSAATASTASTNSTVVISTAAKSSSVRNRLIHDLCRYLPEHLLEPIVTVLLSMLERGLITDVILLAFLVPQRRFLKLNQAVKIRKSIFRQIGLNCPNLIKLDLSGCLQVSNSVIRSILQGCPALEDVVLNNCYKVTDAAFDFSESPFQTLVGCLSLESISLQGCPQITGEIISTLNKNFKRLKYLNLSQCKNVKSPKIQHIFDHNQLQSLNLAFIDDISDEAFLLLPEPHAFSQQQLQALCHHSDSPLQKINLGKSRITDVSIVRMSHMARRLVEIRLQWCNGITDAGIHALVQNCRRLRLIDLKSCSITDESLASIALLSEELQSLDLSWCLGLSDEGVKKLLVQPDHSSSSSRRRINRRSRSGGSYRNSSGRRINGSKLSFRNDESYSSDESGEFPYERCLEHLSIVWCSQVTDDCIASLQGIPTLRSIEVAGSGLSPQGLENLRESGIEVLL